MGSVKKNRPSLGGVIKSASAPGSALGTVNDLDFVVSQTFTLT